MRAVPHVRVPESLAFGGQPPCTRSASALPGAARGENEAVRGGSAGRECAQPRGGAFQAPGARGGNETQRRSRAPAFANRPRGRQRGRGGGGYLAGSVGQMAPPSSGSGDERASFPWCRRGVRPTEFHSGLCRRRGGGDAPRWLLPRPEGLHLTITLVPSSTFGVAHSTPSPAPRPPACCPLVQGEATGQPDTAARRPATDPRAAPLRFTGRGAHCVSRTRWSRTSSDRTVGHSQPAARLGGQPRILAGPWAALTGDSLTHRLTR